MEVRKVEDISFAAFMHKFYLPDIPLIFINAVKVWKAREAFSPGETLLIVFRTWHTTYSLTLKKSIAFDLFRSRNINDFVGVSLSFKKKSTA